MSSTAAPFAVAMLLLLLVVVHLVSADDCHHTEPKPYIWLATKTPYELINNDDSSPVFAAGMIIHKTQLDSIRRHQRRMNMCNNE
jgi:hypothetical protein